MSLYEQIQDAVAAVRQRAPASPSVGLILGSGLGAFAEQIDEPVVIPYGDIPHFPRSAVAGHKGELIVGKIGEATVAVMSGRVHAYEGHSMERVTFPVRVLAALGVRTLLVTNAAGGVNPTFQPGELMAITDHLNLTGDNPLRGHNDERLGPRFPDMSEAYSRDALGVLREAARFCNLTLREGIYAGLMGPTYETPAEVRMLQRLGADAVGMSTVPEVIVARHQGLRVAGVSVITNHGAGIATEPLSHDDVKAVAARVQKPLRMLLARAVLLLK